MIENFKKRFPLVCNPNVRMDFQFKYSVENGNPNGDPNQEGSPRTSPDGDLEVTEHSIKRSVRDFAEDVLGLTLYLSRKESNADKTTRQISQKADGAIVPKGKAKKAGDKPPVTTDELTKAACSTFWDVRMFGGVYQHGMTAKSDAFPSGLSNRTVQIKGPVYLHAVGLSKANEHTGVEERTITRMIASGDESEGDKNRTMGRKTFVRHADFTHKGFYSPRMGEKTGVTEDDLAQFWIALLHCWQDYRYSTMRGVQKITGLTVKVYKDAWGLDEGVEVKVL